MYKIVLYIYIFVLYRIFYYHKNITILYCSIIIRYYMFILNRSFSYQNTVLVGTGDWGSLSYDTLLRDGAGSTGLPELSAEARSSSRQFRGLVIFSSGTSGLPKGVMHSHFSIVASICQNT